MKRWESPLLQVWIDGRLKDDWFYTRRWEVRLYFIIMFSTKLDEKNLWLNQIFVLIMIYNY